MSFTDEDSDKHPLTEQEIANLKSEINFLEIDICNKKLRIEMIKDLLKECE